MSNDKSLSHAKTRRVDIFLLFFRRAKPNMDHKRIVDELTQGKEFAKQLMIHLDNPESSNEVHEILIHNILNSYDTSLSLLTGHGLSPVSHSHGGMGLTRLESQPPFVVSPHSASFGRELENLDHKDLNAER